MNIKKQPTSNKRGLIPFTYDHKLSTSDGKRDPWADFVPKMRHFFFTVQKDMFWEQPSFAWQCKE